MDKVKIDVSGPLTVRIQSIGGDLRMSGGKGNQFEAQAPEEGALQVEPDGDEIGVTCRSSCLMFLPAETRVEAEQIGGDARVTGIINELMIKTARGDLSLRRVGRSTFELVGGDLHARKVSGDLTVDRVGGDVVAESVEGDTRLRTVGGDLVLRRAGRVVEASVGGDASLALSSIAGTKSVIQAGGDVSCWLPEDASATVIVRAGGDMALPSDIERERSDEGTILQLGEGEATIELSAGGNLWLHVGTRELDFTGDLVGNIIGDVDARIAEMEARFNAIGAGIYTFDAERIGERVRRSVERARRKAVRAQAKAEKHVAKLEKARARAARKVAKSKRRQTITFGVHEPHEPVVSEEERLAVLRMLEKGMISVDEAEELLKTLGGES
jgi:hypothetical protein